MEKMECHMRVSGSPLTTQIAYLRALRDLMEKTGDIPENLSAERIKKHLSDLRLNLSSSGLNNHVCAIKYYFRNVEKRPDLVVDIPNPRVAKYIQEVLTINELEVLFAACNDMRELAMVHLLYDCGLRSREVCNIRLTDFERAYQKLTLRNSKGGKLRVVPYSATLRKTFAAYFATLKSHPTTYLFERINEPGTPITVRGVQYIVGQVVKRSRLKKDIHPQTFRHTFAVHYLDNGGSLLRLKELLGHEHIETTLHYLKFSKIPLTEVQTPLEIMLLRKPKS
jgi:site-specific recombinase XerD